MRILDFKYLQELYVFIPTGNVIPYFFTGGSVMKYIVTAVSILLAVSVSFGESIEVPNFSFENSPAAKTWNWNDQENTGVDVIEDWNLDYSGSTSDSGVEDNSIHASSTGTWHAFLYGPWTPGSLYNIDYNINASPKINECGCRRV